MSTDDSAATAAADARAAEREQAEADAAQADADAATLRHQQQQRTAGDADDSTHTAVAGQGDEADPPPEDETLPPALQARFDAIVQARMVDMESALVNRLGLNAPTTRAGPAEFVTPYHWGAYTPATRPTPGSDVADSLSRASAARRPVVPQPTGPPPQTFAALGPHRPALARNRALPDRGRLHGLPREPVAR